MKKCKTCGEEKVFSEFSKHKRYADGYYYQCKVCMYKIAKDWKENNPDKVREMKRNYRSKNVEHCREMDRIYYENNHEKRLEQARKGQMKYYRTEKGQAKYDEQGKLVRARYPEKCRARSLLSNAIVDGKIIKPTKCSLCGSDQFTIDAHHPDYSKPYDVIWLCKPCHGITHRRIKTHRDRLSEKTSKEDATVKPHEETVRENSEEGSPP